MTHVATHPFRVLSLFSGVGGLDLGIKIAVPGARIVGHVEREPYAAAALVARMEDAAMDQAPIWDDVTSFDGSPWRGLVDCIAGGFPCQDISTAGRQEGIRKGNRSGLWFEFGRIIGEVGPRYVFVENVAALALRGLDIVLGTLADLGFDAEWITLGAGDVGAPHQRDRLFILAHRQGGGLGELRESFRSQHAQGRLADRRDEGLAHPEHAGPPYAGAAGGARAASGDAGGPDSGVADAADDQRRGGVGGAEEGAWPVGRGGGRPSGGGGEVDHAEESGLEGRAGGGGAPRAGSGQAGGEIPCWPPGREAWAEWADLLNTRPYLSPAVEPGFRVLVDGLAVVVDKSRADQLRCAGNGVVALQAAVAFTELVRRIG